MTSTTTAAALAAAAPPSQISAGTVATVSGTLFILLAGGALIVYAVKHKGWDAPQIIVGYLYCLVVSGVAWGASLNGSISGGISALGGGLIKFISNLG